MKPRVVNLLFAWIILILGNIGFGIPILMILNKSGSNPEHMQYLFWFGFGYSLCLITFIDIVLREWNIKNFYDDQR